ncbi:MAG: U32 family peptidase [Clostridia bacterium]|nr:U32 family peptidase [Clostridia bacterium]
MGLPELLAPAGGLRQLRAALRFGADAVYVGLRFGSLRARAVNLTPDELAEAVRFTHALGKKLYLALNILPFDGQMGEMLQAARLALELGVDAAIVADAGLVALLRAELPELTLHLSTQANTLNTHAARFWHAQGISRIIVARELSLAQITAMRQALPDTLELEAFVHGAMCVSYSGRCLLSAALAHRSANRGDCAQPCRWNYTLVEEGDKRAPLPIVEDERGAAVLSAGDLCMIEHLPALCAARLTGFKIEGRMKSEYYVATVVGAYRRALDGAASPQSLRAELDKVSHRAYDTGFYFGAPEQPGGAEGYSQDAEYVGYVLELLPDGWGRIEVRNRFFVGDELEALTPRSIVSFSVSQIRLEETGELVSVINRPLAVVHVPLPQGVEADDLLRGPCRNHNNL